MKNIVVCVSVIVLVIAVGAIAQTQEKTDSVTPEPETVQTAATPSPVAPEASKTPRVYPIAAGVWYPGEPLPEKPFRYYRIRCWPGCHHNSEYGKYEDLPENGTPAHKSSKPESHK